MRHYRPGRPPIHIPVLSSYFFLLSTLRMSPLFPIGSDHEQEDGKADVADVEKLFFLSGSRAIDLSQRMLTKSDVVALTKTIKEMESPDPVVLLLSKNNMTDLNFKSSSKSTGTDCLGSLIAAPLVEAVDLSYNYLGTGFESALVESLRLKKKSLQYLLVNGNVPMSMCPHLTDVLSLMSEKSWGIAITLEDMVEIKDHVKKKVVHYGCSLLHYFSFFTDVLYLLNSLSQESPQTLAEGHICQCDALNFLKFLIRSLVGVELEGSKEWQMSKRRQPTKSNTRKGEVQPLR